MKPTNLSLLMAIHGHPLAITEAGLRAVLAVASGNGLGKIRGSVQAEPRAAAGSIMRSEGTAIKGAGLLSIREGGVGILSIRGPIIRHADYFDEISGATSLATVSRNMAVAADMKEIQSLIVDAESPGGEMPGEIIDLIREFPKPMTGWVGSWGMSSMYWMLSAMDKIVVHRGAHTGSVGVRAAFIDTKRLQENQGVETIEMMASQSPHKISDPKDPEGRARIQAILDAVAEEFIGDVAAGRGLSRKRVLADFGKGDAVSASRAVEVGMADAVDTMESVIAQMAGGKKYRPAKTSVAASATIHAEEPAVAKRKTWAELLLGPRAQEEVPEGLDGGLVHGEAPNYPPGTTVAHLPSGPQGPAVVGISDVTARGGQREAGNEEEIRRQRDAAEARAAKAEAALAVAEDEAIDRYVAVLVGRRIHAAERKVVAGHLKAMQAKDRQLGLSGPDSLLAQAKAILEARPQLGLLDEVVLNNRLPVGGQEVTGSGPGDDAGDRDEAQALAMADAILPRPSRNGH